MHVPGQFQAPNILSTGRTVCALFVAAFFMLAPFQLDANGERTISFYNIHTKETLHVVYKRNGRYVPEALDKLNWHLRDWRRNEPTKIDPDLIDLVWEVHAELGSRMPVHVISAYRSPQTNSMLLNSRGGQAKKSQHMLGKAMDVRFPDIPVRRLRYSALLREQGGVGYYPTSATPFVHIDTGRVRHWPRMDREELALLFPSGRTQHRPRNGGPVTPLDAMTARSNHPDLAQRVAAFHDNRRNGPIGEEPNVRVAMAPRAAPLPQLIAQPKLVARPSEPRGFARAAALDSGWIATPRPAPRQVAAFEPAVPLPTRLQSDPAPLPFRRSLADPAEAMRPQRVISEADRNGLNQLASAVFGAPASGPATLSRHARVEPPRPNEWVSAPAYDEEHPEELFYLPFPIAPYITQSASIDDAALVHLTHPDVDRTLGLLVADDTDDPTLQIRPGLQTANLMWSQSFDRRSAGRAGESTPEPEPSPWQHAASTWLGRRLVQLAGQ